MKGESFKKLYEQNGFCWTDYLQQFCFEYAGKEFQYIDPLSGTQEIARFMPSAFISAGRSYGLYEQVVVYLNEEVAPIGECNRGNIRLLLTHSGKLVGFADYLLLRWGDKESDWRSSLEGLLHGVEASRIGVVE